MEKGCAKKTVEKENIDEKHFPYRQVVGSLIYLVVGSRLDLAFSVGYLSRLLKYSTKEDVIRIKRV